MLEIWNTLFLVWDKRYDIHAWCSHSNGKEDLAEDFSKLLQQLENALDSRIWMLSKQFRLLGKGGSRIHLFLTQSAYKLQLEVGEAFHFSSAFVDRRDWPCCSCPPSHFYSQKTGACLTTFYKK